MTEKEYDTPQAVIGTVTVPLDTKDTSKEPAKKTTAKKAAKKTAKKTAKKVEAKLAPAKKGPPTKAEQLWGKIKDAKLEIFGLPNRTVQMHTTWAEDMAKVYPDHLYITLASTAVLPALEETLKGIDFGKFLQFDLSQEGGYTIIKVLPKA